MYVLILFILCSILIVYYNGINYKTVVPLFLVGYWLYLLSNNKREELELFESVLKVKPQKKVLTNRERKVSGYMKKLVGSQQDWKCNNCGRLLPASFEVDHIIPLYKEGTNDISNLRALCRNCHGEKTFRDML